MLQSGEGAAKTNPKLFLAAVSDLRRAYPSQLSVPQNASENAS